MTPTSELRFVERDLGVLNGARKTVRILQQKWIDEDCVLHVYQHGNGPMQREYLHAWRDVPLAKEEDK